MRSIQKKAIYLLKVLTCYSAVLLLLFSNNTYAQTKGEKVEVSKSSTIFFSEIEKYNKEHPEDPNEKRIGSVRNGVKQREEDEDELPIIKIPKNAKVMSDPFGKMASAVAGRPSPGINALNSVAPNIDFNAIDDAGNVIPPDVGGQIGPNHVMTTLNGTGVRISSRTGTVISTVTLNAFFATVGTPSTFDPKVMYDPFNNRWIVVACGNAVSANSALLVGISANNDPTGSWQLYSLDVDGTNATWFDYPSIGFNKDWVVIGGNMFTVASNSFSTGKVFIYKKADLYAGVLSPSVTVINSGAGLCPAITYDNSLSTMYLVQSVNGNSNGNGFIALYNISGAVGSEVLSGATFISTPNTWSFSGGSNFAPQSGTANKVATGDHRIQKTIYRNGSIWTTHTVFLPAAAPTKSAAQWWQLSTAGALLQRGRIEDGSGENFFAFPSIDVNKNNDVMIGCAKFSATTFPSACYSIRMAADPINTFQSDFVYKAGQANYFKTFGGSTNRWGDYTSVSVDPNDDMNFWTVQEYAKTGNFWGTWWAGVCTPPPTPNTISGISPAFAGSTNQVFSVATVSGATSYTWNFPAGCTITSGINTNSVTVTLGSTSGNVTVTANNGSCSSATQSFSLTVNPATTLTGSATNNGPLCPGNTLNLSATASGGIPPYTFSWSGPNLTATAGQNQTIPSVTSLNNGVYSVVITDNNSPASVITETTTVVVNTLPTANITSVGPLTYCNGDSVLLKATVSNNRTYQWIRGTNNLTGQTSNSFVAKTKGNYKVKITNTLTGCSRTSTATKVTVNTLPAVAAISGNLSICKGSSTLLTNATPNGVWGIDTVVATISNTGLVTGKLVGNAKVTYTTAPNTNGCINKATANVAINALPSISGNITGLKTACVGKSSQLANSTAGGTWSSSNFSIASVSSTGLVTGVAIGNVTITYTTAPNTRGCTNSTSTNFSVSAPCLSKPDYAKGGSQTEVVSPSSLEVSIAPNPTGNVFNVQVKAPKKESISLRVLDVNGKTAFAAKGMPGQIFHFGEQLKAGTYMVEVRQGEEVKTVKAVKVGR